MRESQYGDDEDQEELRHTLKNSYDHRNELISSSLYFKEIEKSKPHSQCSYLEHYSHYKIMLFMSGSKVFDQVSYDYVQGWHNI